MALQNFWAGMIDKLSKSGYELQRNRRSILQTAELNQTG